MEFSKAIPLSIRGGHPLPGAARHHFLQQQQASSTQIREGASRGPAGRVHHSFSPAPALVPTAAPTAVDVTSPLVLDKDLANGETARPNGSPDSLYCHTATDATGRHGYYFTTRFNQWTESTIAEAEKRKAAVVQVDTSTASKKRGHDKEPALVIQQHVMSAPSEEAARGAHGGGKLSFPGGAGTKRPAAYMDKDDEDTALAPSKPSRIVKRVKRAFDHTTHTVFGRVFHDKNTDNEAESGKTHVDTERAGSRLLEGTRSVLSRLSLRQRGHDLLSAHATFRKIKVCIVGAQGSGKTTLINRLITGQFQPASPSFSTDLRIVPIPAVEQQNMGVMELWDISGSPYTSISQQLMSNWFHVAIICFGIEDERNVMPVVDEWYPALRASLIDCPVFVLGLKQDTRPTFHPLELPFLPTKEAAQLSMGVKAANKIRAARYMECSAVTGENVVGCFQEIYRSVSKQMEGREKDRTHQLRLERAKERARDAGRRISKALHN